ncbi:MAG: Hsp20 family protein [Burkholderiaceae bacterium]
MSNLARYETFDNLFNDLFKGFYVRPVGLSERLATDPKLSIRLDVQENEKDYKVHADIPGFSREEVKVGVDGDVVTITAERSKKEEMKEGGKVIFSERSHGLVSRSFHVDQEIDVDKAQAKFENGVLEMTLVKKTSSKSKQLKID